MYDYVIVKHILLIIISMVVPRSRLKFVERAFSIAAPRAWNSIPADLRATLNTATFKKNPKTFLFRESYSTF